MKIIKIVKESLNEEVESHPADDLKSNFRDWELYGHENDGEELFNILLRRHPDFDEDELRQMSYDWVGQEMDKELDESLNEKLETFDLDLSN